MAVGTGIVLVVAIVAIVLLLAVVLRPRRRRLVNRNRAGHPFSLRWRRMEAIKRAAAADIALMQDKDIPDGRQGRP